MGFPNAGLTGRHAVTFNDNPFYFMSRALTAFSEHLILETRDRAGKSDDSSSLGDEDVSLEYEDFCNL